jgi:hypothetical protein
MAGERWLRDYYIENPSHFRPLSTASIFERGYWGRGQTGWTNGTSSLVAARYASSFWVVSPVVV